MPLSSQRRNTFPKKKKRGGVLTLSPTLYNNLKQGLTELGGRKKGWRTPDLYIQSKPKGKTVGNNSQYTKDSIGNVTHMLQQENKENVF